MLIIDMINCLDFPGADLLAPGACAAARVIKRLRDEADAAGIPVIYVNDNFGEWHSERSRLLERVSESHSPLAGVIDPRPDDYFIIKPKVSGFYATNLPVLLPKLGVSRLVLTGIAADMCVLFTAADAHMRDYDLWVPCDAVAAEEKARAGWALGLIEHGMAACVAPASALRLAAWAGGSLNDLRCPSDSPPG